MGNIGPEGSTNRAYIAVSDFTLTFSTFSSKYDVVTCNFDNCEKTQINYVEYGNTGCGVFKWGVQN